MDGVAGKILLPQINHLTPAVWAIDQRDRKYDFCENDDVIKQECDGLEPEHPPNVATNVRTQLSDITGVRVEISTAEN